VQNLNRVTAHLQNDQRLNLACRVEDSVTPPNASQPNTEEGHKKRAHKTKGIKQPEETNIAKLGFNERIQNSATEFMKGDLTIARVIEVNKINSHLIKLFSPGRFAYVS
jgi:hypothetical protein